jgi:desulfoferrodoxin-like iron-binding protein
MAEEKSQHVLYKCGNCGKIVYLMEAGFGKELKCCDQQMKEMTEEEKKPYHPRFPKPGAP